MQIKTIIMSGILLSLGVQSAAAEQILSYQQGVDGYEGTLSVLFNYGRHQTTLHDTHYERWTGTNRNYNIEHFSLDDASLAGDITRATLTFYRVGGWVYHESDIKVRQILDPDNLGSGYLTGWKQDEGFRSGGNLESRGDTTSPDTKWRLSDPDGPDDLGIDYFQGVLRSLAESPSFRPVQSDPVGTAYTVDVTADVQCIQQGQCPNQGWALTHADDDANIQHVTANSRYAEAMYRPKLTITLADDHMEPLVLRSLPNGASLPALTTTANLFLTTN
jgi:hypothetical protein